jgi:hypothetical protein
MTTPTPGDASHESPLVVTAEVGAAAPMQGSGSDAVHATLENTPATADTARRKPPPFFDADPDDIVPGYGDSDTWYEP